MIQSAKSTLVVLFAGAMLAACDKTTSTDTASSSAPKARTLQLAHASAEREDDVYHNLAVNFSKQLETATDGKIKLQILGSAQLGGERDVVEGLQLGTVDMTAVSSIPLGTFAKRAMVLDLPYLFNSYQTAFSALDSEFIKPIEEDLEKINLKVLAWGHGGFRNAYNSKHSIRTLSDVKNLKMRVPENPLYLDTWRALDVNVTPMAFHELFTGLQQRTIDGAEAPTTLFYSGRYFEAAKFLSKTEHVYVALPLVISGKYWNSLDEKDQQKVLAAAKKAVKDQREYFIRNEAEVEKKLAEAGVTINADVDKNEFRKAVMPLYDKYSPEIGKELVQRALKLSN
ncbi:TRAP transporter substrate-binding protein [Xanthomonas axonopodis]|uniref:TRAP transporter substrate-binding protein n=1 Tax=Xanthomonas axonopodis TaxID=53413 RepID=UPI003556B429